MPPPDMTAILRHHRHHGDCSHRFPFSINQLSGDASTENLASPASPARPDLRHPALSPVTQEAAVTQTVTQRSNRCVTSYSVDLTHKRRPAPSPVTVVTQKCTQPGRQPR